MKEKITRAVVALILALAAGGAGYVAGGSGAQDVSVSIPAQTVSAPAANSIRVIYSLDQKRNDQELIALINEAEDYIYFAIYTFTLPTIADALVEAKKRGVDVKGIMDSEQSRNSYGAPITAALLNAGIPVVTERHATGNGIMHIKLLVTEQAYAFGSYNWTRSATTLNDEILEIGTDRALRQAYENILKKRQGRALSPLVGENCGVCQMLTRPQIQNEVKSGDRIVTCESCSRILYIE